jgi:hypothetical protein
VLAEKRYEKAPSLNIYEERVTIVKKYCSLSTLLLIAALMMAVIPAYAAGEPSDNTLTRGSRFTVNITGLPSTSYYIWLTRTSSMTGKPGDQPPVIVPFQSGIQQDPPEGPFTIGSYEINNGNGRTILDDIAPSTPLLSNTNYYALVTTDTDGRVVVAFQTTSATSTKTFSVKVENSRSAAGSDILLERGLPTRVPTSTRKETALFTQVLTTTTSLALTDKITATIVPTTIPEQTRTPPQRAGSRLVYTVIAMFTGVILWCSKDLFPVQSLFEACKEN